MVRAGSAFALLMGVVLTFSVAAQAPTHELKVILLNGKTGQPMPGERILFFFETKADQPSHEQSAEVRTGRDGIAILTLPLGARPFLQAFVDFRSVCWGSPNSLAIPVQQAVSHGALSPNNCGRAHPSVRPGELILFARPATLRESMGW